MQEARWCSCADDSFEWKTVPRLSWAIVVANAQMTELRIMKTRERLAFGVQMLDGTNAQRQSEDGPAVSVRSRRESFAGNSASWTRSGEQSPAVSEGSTVAWLTPGATSFFTPTPVVFNTGTHTV